MATEPNGVKNEQPESRGPGGVPVAGGAPLDRTSSPNAPRRAKTLTGMALLLPVLLLGGALWLKRAPGAGDDTGNPAPMPNATAAASPAPAETATPDGGAEARKVLDSYTVYLPTDDGKLVRTMVPMNAQGGTQNSGATREMWADIALGTLFSQGKAYFPTGSHPIAPCKVEKDVVTVDLNRAYLANSESWSSAETTTRVMSIVNTVSATDAQLTGRPGSVRLLVEGKPVSTLGEFDASGPISPSTTAVPAP